MEVNREELEKMERKKKHKHIEYGRYGYFFIAPFFIAYCLFQLWPLLNTFYYSTLSYYKRNGREFIEFCGLDNFKNILGLTAGEKGIDLFEKYSNHVGKQFYSTDFSFTVTGSMADG